jgi:hypothetical protein
VDLLGPHESGEKFKFDLTLLKISGLENTYARSRAFVARKVLFESDEYTGAWPLTAHRRGSTSAPAVHQPHPHNIITPYQW